MIKETNKGEKQKNKKEKNERKDDDDNKLFSTVDVGIVLVFIIIL